MASFLYPKKEVPSFKCNNRINPITVIQKQLAEGTTQSSNIIILSALEDSGNNLRMDIKYDRLDNLKSFIKNMVESLQKIKFIKLEFRSIRIDKEYKTEINGIELKTNVSRPTSQSEFGKNLFIIDLISEGDLFTFNIYKMGEQAPRVIFCTLKDDSIDRIISEFNNDMLSLNLEYKNHNTYESKTKNNNFKPQTTKKSNNPVKKNSKYEMIKPKSKVVKPKLKLTKASKTKPSAKNNTKSVNTTKTETKIAVNKVLKNNKIENKENNTSIKENSNTKTSSNKEKSSLSYLYNSSDDDSSDDEVDQKLTIATNKTDQKSTTVVDKTDQKSTIDTDTSIAVTESKNISSNNSEDNMLNSLFNSNDQDISSSNDSDEYVKVTPKSPVKKLTKNNKILKQSSLHRPASMLMSNFSDSDSDTEVELSDDE